MILFYVLNRQSNSDLSCHWLYHQLDKALLDKLIYLRTLRHMMMSHGEQQNKTTYAILSGKSKNEII
jgi:hypothetical protein